MNKCTQKVVFYHMKGHTTATHSYMCDSSVKEINHECLANEAVLDAIFYVEDEKVTTYSNNVTRKDVYDNVYAIYPELEK